MLYLKADFLGSQAESLAVSPRNRKIQQCLGNNLKDKKREDFSLLSSPL